MSDDLVADLTHFAADLTASAIATNSHDLADAFHKRAATVLTAVATIARLQARVGELERAQEEALQTTEGASTLRDMAAGYIEGAMWKHKAQTAETRVKVLSEALAPFGHAYERWSGDRMCPLETEGRPLAVADDDQVVLPGAVDRLGKASVEFGAFRRAHTALAETKHVEHTKALGVGE